MSVVGQNLYTLHLGDCLEVLQGIPDCSVDSVVTDPPYGLSFMGKKWDYDVPSVEIWSECLRVLKPGGHLLAFAGTRTQHRMAVRIEDAGFEIRDMIAWVYGSGFPKSHNGEWGGTALKPGLEPITMARKPLIGTVEQNWITHGTGSLNIDGSRVSLDGDYKSKANGRPSQTGLGDNYNSANANQPDTVGRWPANLIHDGSDEVLAAFPDAKGQQGDLKSHNKDRQSPNGCFGKMSPAKDHTARIETEKSAARFFYCAKASRADRNEGCEAFEKKPLNWSSGDKNPGSFQSDGTDKTSQNNHPTVKPTDLMRYLCRLVTPPGGVVLDPFMGSGSTGKAAMREELRFIGIEREAQYIAIAKARISAEIKSAAANNTPAQAEMFERAV
jgi:DNA modification methylase